MHYVKKSPCLLAIFLLHIYVEIMVHERTITQIRDTRTIKANDIFPVEFTLDDPAGIPPSTGGGILT